MLILLLPVFIKDCSKPAELFAGQLLTLHEVRDQRGQRTFRQLGGE